MRLGRPHKPVDVKVSEERADSIEALNLIEQTRRYMKSLYSDGPVHQFDPYVDAAPPGVFVVARVDGKAVGCGALRPLEGHVGEVKRVFVLPECRRMGIAGRIMAVLEDKGLQKGFTTLRLETGTKQPEAIALYDFLGYRRIPPFGEYVSDPYSICFEKDLSARKRSD
jgi:putative acetyltransferase